MIFEAPLRLNRSSATPGHPLDLGDAPSPRSVIKRCSIAWALDMDTVWLVYRISRSVLRNHLTWRQVYRQFAAHPETPTTRKPSKTSRVQALRELKKIKLAWPELNYTTAPGVLILHPSTPAIPPAQQLSLVEKAPRVLTPRRKDETENIHRDLPKGD